MKIMSIDLETTGLNPRIHGITEFAAIYADTETGQQDTFYRWLNPDDYTWSNYCLSLHAKWLSEVVPRIHAGAWEGEPEICSSMSVLVNQFERWITNRLELDLFNLEGKLTKFNAAGKNFGSFDSQFLKAARFPDMFRHRSIDPTGFYTLPSDKIPPELKLCKERAAARGAKFDTLEVAHSAIKDAQDIVDLIRFGLHNK